MIAIIDYGMGNIHSVKKALDLMGAHTLVTNNPVEIAKADKLLLPGVGAFGDAMRELEKQGLIIAIKGAAKQKKILLGICLGMQLLFEASEESSGVKGLGILKGEVKKFPGTLGLKVPHMGWNQLKKSSAVGGSAFGGKSDCPLLHDIEDNACVYFCHSYYAQPKEKEVNAAVTDYGGDFSSLVWQDSVFGVQFHPEKSQTIGLKMIKNFVNL